MKILLFFFLFSFDLYAQKLVSTSPALTEIVTLLGFEKNIIARTPYCLDALNAQKIGTALELDVEKVVLLNPDLVLLQENTETKTSNNLKKLKIKYKSFKIVNLEDIYKTTTELASIFGIDGKEIVKNYNISGQSRFKKGLVMLGGVPGKSVMVAGTKTYYSQIIEKLGMLNVSPSEQWPNLSAEKIRSLVDDNTVVIEIVPQKVRLWSQSDWQSFCPKCKIIPIVSKRAAYPGLKVIEVMSKALTKGASHD